jgi:hypothetical protein
LAVGQFRHCLEEELRIARQVGHANANGAVAGNGDGAHRVGGQFLAFLAGWPILEWVKMGWHGLSVGKCGWTCLDQVLAHRGGSNGWPEVDNLWDRKLIAASHVKVETISSLMLEPTRNSEGAFGMSTVRTGERTPSLGFSMTK